jgi:hypothetical protein
MLKKTLLSIMIVVLISFGVVFSASADDGDSTRAPDTQKQDVKVEVVMSVSDIDKDWPITKIEEVEWVDETSGDIRTTTLIFRESPPSFEFISPEACGEIGFMACTQNGMTTVEAYTPLGSVRAYSKHTMYIYCNGGDCNYRKPHQLEVWWTRTNSNWRVQNAVVNWGCTDCLVCPSGSTNYIYTNGPFTPTWFGNTTSVTVYSQGNFSIQFPWDGTTDRASSDSDVYDGWLYKGHVHVNPGFGL